MIDKSVMDEPGRACTECGGAMVEDHFVWPTVAPSSRVQLAYGCLTCDLTLREWSYGDIPEGASPNRGMRARPEQVTA